MKYTIAGLFCIMFWSCCSDEEVTPEEENSAPELEWREKTGFGNKIYGHVGFSIGDKGYIATGISGVVAEENYLNGLWEYDPISSSWSQKADYPGIGRRGASAFVLNNEAYVGLGMQSTASGLTRYSDIYKYNPGTNSWAQLNNFNGGGRNAAYSFVVDGKAYIGGGFGSTLLGDLWEYDLVNDTWVQKADFDGGVRQGAATFVINNTAYIANGGTCCGTNATYYNDLWAYDYTNDTWSKKADFPGDGRTLSVGFEINDQGFVGFGAQAGATSFYKDVWKYDGEKDTWSEAVEFPSIGRSHIAVFTIGNSAFTGFGSESSGGVGLDDFYELILE